MSLYSIILLNAVALDLVKRFGQEYHYRDIPNTRLAAWANDYKSIFTYECVTEVERVNILELDIHFIVIENYETSSKKVFLFTEHLMSGNHHVFETYGLQLVCIRQWTDLKSLISVAYNGAAIFTVGNSATLYFLLEKCLRSTHENMVNDILENMEKYKVFTMKELAQCNPYLIRKYMGFPNLANVVANCVFHFMMLPPSVRITPSYMFEQFSTLMTYYPGGGNACKIVNFVKFQGVDLNSFYQAIYSVFFHTFSARKGLVVYGQSFSGKTSFLKPLTYLFSSFYGLDPNLLNLKMCIGKQLLFLDNFTFRANNVPALTKLAEGEYLPIRLQNGEFFDIRVNGVLATCTDKPEALNRRFHVFEFFRNVSDYVSYSTLCERNQLGKSKTGSDPMNKSYESYWSLYETKHAKCSRDCNHCSRKSCHFAASGQCQDHEENVHSKYAVKKMNCTVQKDPITPADWLDFLVNNMRDWLSSRTE